MEVKLSGITINGNQPSPSENPRTMEDKSPLPPCLPCIPSFKIAKGRVFTDQSYAPFFTASQVKQNKMLERIEVLARKNDAARFLIEAKMGLWDLDGEGLYEEANKQFEAWKKDKGPE